MRESIEKMFDLSGQVAMVVGGARHIGYDIATVLGEAGADLIITSRSLESAQKAADLLKRDLGVDVLALALDNREPDQITDVSLRAAEWKGHIDILVNNAGGTPQDRPRHLFEVDLSRWLT